MDIELEKMKTEQNSVVLAYILWWFLGMFGAHRFYTKQAMAWLFPVCFLLGFILTFIFIGYLIFLGLAIWWIIDGIRLNGIVKKYNLQIIEKYEAQKTQES